MYRNGPVSIRWARTDQVDGSSVRSDTQDQTRPCSSGCIVSRNRTRFGSSSRTSAAEYSVNSSGHERTSLVTSQVNWMGASTTTRLSVCAATVTSPFRPRREPAAGPRWVC